MPKKTVQKKSDGSINANAGGRTEIFSFQSAGAANVQLVGDFTQWQERPIQLQKDSGDIWKATVILPPGTHQYKFVVDGNWCDDPKCDQRAPNPFGGENNLRRVA